MDKTRAKTASFSVSNDAAAPGAGDAKPTGKAKFDSIAWDKATVEAAPSKVKGVPQANIIGADGKNHGVVMVQTVKKDGPQKGNEFVAITGSAGFNAELNAASKLPEVNGKRINDNSGKTNPDGSPKEFRMAGIKVDADKAPIVAEKLAASASAQSQVTAKAIVAALALSEKQKKAAPATY